MHQQINLTEYNLILNSKRRSGPEVQKHYGMCMHILISRWASRVNSHQLAILMFVFDRTFYHAKMSETVVFDQFLHGMESSKSDEMVFCGLTMSKNTLAMQLKSLCDDDFLHVRACMSADGKAETKPRLYAINCKRLFNLDLADEENPMILREPKQKRVVVQDENAVEVEQIAPRSVLREPKKRAFTPPPNLGGIYIINTDTKVSIVGGASLAERDGKVDVFARMEEVRLQRIAAATARRATRPTSNRKNPADSRAALQSHIDAAMAQYHPTLPRMLMADKPFGVLRKRATEAQLDVQAFLTWAVEFWQMVTSAHERGARRTNQTQSKYVHKPMPAAPDFTTICYRFPYFLQCYRSHVHTEGAGLATRKEDILEKQVAKLSRSLAAAKQDAAGALERERNMRRRARPVRPEEDEATPTPTVARIHRQPIAARPPVDELFDDELPAWDDHPVTTRRTK